MQTYVNEAYIADRLRLARRLQFLGFGILFAALILTLLPTLGAPPATTTNVNTTPVAGVISGTPIISVTNAITASGPISDTKAAGASSVNLIALVIYYVGLIVGFQVLSAGQWMSRRWRTRPRPDEQIAEELKGATNKYAFYNYIPLPPITEKSPRPPMLDHLIQAPEGYLLVQMQPEFGQITYDGRRWNRRVGMLERLGLIGAPPLGDPGAALNVRILAFKRWLESLGVSNVLVDGVIVFNNSRAKVNIKTEAPYPVINHHEIVDYLREMSPQIDATEGEAKETIKITGEIRSKVHNALLSLIPAVKEAPAKPNAREAAKPNARSGVRPSDAPQPTATKAIRPTPPRSHNGNSASANRDESKRTKP